MLRNIKLFWEVVKEAFCILSTGQKKQLILVFLSIISTSVLEFMGVGVILPFIQAILNSEELMNKSYIKFLCSIFRISDSTSLLILLGILIASLYIFKNIFILFAGYYQVKYATRLQRELSVDMMRSLMKRPYSFFLTIDSGIILRLFNTSIAAFFSIIESLIALATDSITIFLIASYLIYADCFTALCILLIMLLTMYFIIFSFKPVLKRAGIANSNANYKKYKSLLNIIGGIKDIYVTKREEIFINSYEKASEETSRCQLVYTTLNAAPNRCIESVCVSAIIGVIIFRLILFNTGLETFIPKLAVFAMAAFKILPSIGKIISRINSIVYYRLQQKEVYQNIIEVRQYDAEMSHYVSSAQAVGKNGFYQELEKDPVKNAKWIGKVEFKIEFSGVEWKYQNQICPVLQDFNLTIHKGEAIGLIGTSGAGKSTVIDILLGLLKPQEGYVYIDDKDIFAMPHVWAQMVGYVPQSVYLMDETIRANVAFGLQDIKDEEIWAALEKAQLRSFVESLPKGLDTFVGERGVRLSGGQRQRIAIARALYSKPQIIVLDEATAALDNETEAAVMESIEVLHGEVTLIIVAHRLTTIRKCDRIFEIANGVATERSHEEVFRITESV